MRPSQIRMDEELYDKIKYIARKQNRSWNGQANWILQQYIKDYEKVNGKIDPKELENI